MFMYLFLSKILNSDIFANIDFIFHVFMLYSFCLLPQLLNNIFINILSVCLLNVYVLWSDRLYLQLRFTTSYTNSVLYSLTL